MLPNCPKHYVHIGLLCEWEDCEPKVLESEKSESCNWYEIDKLPEPMFETCKIAIDSYRTGKNYYDIPVLGY